MMRGLAVIVAAAGLLGFPAAAFSSPAPDASALYVQSNIPPYANGQFPYGVAPKHKHR